MISVSHLPGYFLKEILPGLALDAALQAAIDDCLLVLRKNLGV
jgi:hypothetical protein